MVAKSGEIKPGVDYVFSGNELVALTPTGQRTLAAVMSQRVFPFTLAVYAEESSVSFKGEYPVNEAERILQMAASYWID